MDRQILVGSATNAAAAFFFRAPQREFGVKGFGAKGDGTTPDTAAIQAAIDAAAAAGGGARVLVRDGSKYLVSALHLYVTLAGLRRLRGCASISSRT